MTLLSRRQRAAVMARLRLTGKMRSDLGVTHVDRRYRVLSGEEGRRTERWDPETRTWVPAGGASDTTE